MKSTLARAAIIGLVALTNGSLDGSVAQSVPDGGAHEGRKLHWWNKGEKAKTTYEVEEAKAIVEAFNIVKKHATDLEQEPSLTAKLKDAIIRLNEGFAALSRDHIKGVDKEARVGDSVEPSGRVTTTTTTTTTNKPTNEPTKTNERSGLLAHWGNWLQKHFPGVTDHGTAPTNARKPNPTSAKGNSGSSGGSGGRGCQPTCGDPDITMAKRKDPIHGFGYDPSYAAQLPNMRKQENQLDAFEQKQLRETNIIRCMFGQPPLFYNKEMADLAEQKANAVWNEGKGYLYVAYHYILNLSLFTKNQNNSDMGENLASFYGDILTEDKAQARFASEYLGPRKGGYEKLDHWTQMVWLGSTDIGCGRHDGQRGYGQGLGILACEYYPAGNFIGKWNEQGPEEGSCVNTQDRCEKEFNYKVGQKIEEKGWLDRCAREAREYEANNK